MRLVEMALSIVFVLGCGAGSYGYARTYVPLDDEEGLADQASPLTYEEIRRAPTEHRDTVVGWFGIVVSVENLEGSNRSRVSMTYRAHQDRHLCADETERSCRVTVSERPGGTFSAEIALRSEDREGSDRVWEGSLLRVYGTPTGELDTTGGPILAVRYYRHWPRREYVTTGAANSMRR